MNARSFIGFAALFVVAAGIEPGCQKAHPGAVQPPLSTKKTDWILSTSDAHRTIDAYIPSSGVGRLLVDYVSVSTEIYSGHYTNGVITGRVVAQRQSQSPLTSNYDQTLDLKRGVLRTTIAGRSKVIRASISGYSNWQQFWSDSDIEIDGDPDAQQATRAEIFYLAGSASPTASIPPFGLSSNGYRGHIFWDAETWMLPALIVQHPDLARGIILYRFQRLKQAEANARAARLPGAQYPWESADSGREEAPSEFAQERHITADVGLAAWQYYLWSGDKQYLISEAWPILEACANYWAGRATKGGDGKYHILSVIGPDETSGVVDDDAWTNSAAAQCLRDAASAAKSLALPPKPNWLIIAGAMSLARDRRTGIPIEHTG